MKNSATRKSASRAIPVFAAAIALAAILVAPAQSASDILLKLEGSVGESGSGDTSHCGDLDISCWTYRDSGTLTCDVCGESPTSATFTTTWLVTVFRNDPCRVKTLVGRMKIAWSDSSVSTATVDGRFIGNDPVLALTGTVDSGSSRAEGASIFGLIEGYDTDVCRAGTAPIAGGLRIAIG